MATLKVSVFLVISVISVPLVGLIAQQLPARVVTEAQTRRVA